MATATANLNGLDLAPILTVNDLQQSIGFYEKLGFTIEERYERDGKLNGGRFAAGQARINLTQDDWAKGRDRAKGTGMRLFIPVEQDVDELAAAVKAAGLSLESGPDDMPWGRTFSLTDPDGFKITIARVHA
jgi:catechol 2,3-dioxygenase-like lactoylglutathione lyase family enzyme